MIGERSSVSTLLPLPSGVAGSCIGGIQTFVRGFIKNAPAHFAVDGMGGTEDRFEGPPDVSVGVPAVPFLAIYLLADPHRRSASPQAVWNVNRLVPRRPVYSTRGRALV